MKKVLKSFLILSGIFIFAGIVTVTVTGIIAAKNGTSIIDLSNIRLGAHFGDGDIESEDYDMSTGQQTVELSDIKGIALSGNYGKVEFVKGDRFAYEIFGGEVDSSMFTHDVENGVWKISIKNKSGFYFFGMGSDDHISKLRITVPSTEILDDIFINLSAGSVNVERLAAKNLRIEMGAGSLEADELVADESATLSVSAGRCKVKNLIAKNPIFRCEAGQIDARGILTGQSEVKCGVGQIGLDAIGNRDDYDYNVKCGVGAIRIDGEQIGGFGTKNSKSHGKENSFKMNCGVGQINLDFVAMNN